MESKILKKELNDIAKKNGFENAFGGWFKESNECIISLVLQKSNFGNYYELNIKIFVQGTFGRHYYKNKDLIKKDIGNIFRAQPLEYDAALDMDSPLEDAERKHILEELFDNFINPFTVKALTRKGIKELADTNQIYLLPAVKKELGF